MITQLINLNVGIEGKIVEIRGGRMVNQRLNDLGLTIGSIITVIRRAPFSGPIHLSVRGSNLAIGRGIAAKIIVQNLIQ